MTVPRSAVDRDMEGYVGGLRQHPLGRIGRCNCNVCKVFESVCWPVQPTVSTLTTSRVETNGVN